MKEDIIPIQDEIVLYQSEDGNVKVDVLFQDETVWLTQEQMAMLFGKGRTTITEHIANIFRPVRLNEVLRTLKRLLSIAGWCIAPPDMTNAWHRL